MQQAPFLLSHARRRLMMIERKIGQATTHAPPRGSRCGAPLIATPAGGSRLRAGMFHRPVAVIADARCKRATSFIDARRYCRIFDQLHERRACERRHFLSLPDDDADGAVKLRACMSISHETGRVSRGSPFAERRRRQEKYRRRRRLMRRLRHRIFH